MRRVALATVLLLILTQIATAQTVYLTDTGRKYHRAGCRYLSTSSKAVDLAEAVAMGYEPCGVCNPPVLDEETAAALMPRLTGRVVAIHDGDSLTLLVDRVQHRIRLNGIDAPERGQAWNQRARQALADLCFGQQAEVILQGTDRYGRELGDVYVGDLFVNAQMVRVGMAWHYKQYSKDETLAALEEEAREAKRGLWADPSPMPPWDYRKE